MFEYKFWHVCFFSFLGYLHVFSTKVQSSSHSWTKETAANMLVLSTERIVRDNENNRQSNLFKSGVPFCSIYNNVYQTDFTTAINAQEISNLRIVPHLLSTRPHVDPLQLQYLSGGFLFRVYLLSGGAY